MKEFDHSNNKIEVCIYGKERIEEGLYKLRVTVKTSMEVGDRIINIVGGRNYELTKIITSTASKSRHEAWKEAMQLVGEFKVV